MRVRRRRRQGAEAFPDIVPACRTPQPEPAQGLPAPSV